MTYKLIHQMKKVQYVAPFSQQKVCFSCSSVKMPDCLRQWEASFRRRRPDWSFLVLARFSITANHPTYISCRSTLLTPLSSIIINQREREWISLLWTSPCKIQGLAYYVVIEPQNYSFDAEGRPWYPVRPVYRDRNQGFIRSVAEVKWANGREALHPWYHFKL